MSIYDYCVKDCPNRSTSPNCHNTCEHYINKTNDIKTRKRVLKKEEFKILFTSERDEKRFWKRKGE